MCDQIEFSNVILLNKCDLVPEKVKNEIRHTISQLNPKAEIIETIRSNVDLNKVINTGKFNFEEAEANSKWLENGRYEPASEVLEYGVSSFLYKRNRPFHPERLHKLLDSSFLLDIVNPEDHAGHLHQPGEDEEMHDEEEEEEEEEDETDEAYEARLQEAKEKFKKERDEAYQKMQSSAFKHLFRSKGFIWLSNRPQLFFEWSQASINNNISVGGPWVCTLEGKSLEQQCMEQEIGDRS